MPAVNSSGSPLQRCSIVTPRAGNQDAPASSGGGATAGNTDRLTGSDRNRCRLENPDAVMTTASNTIGWIVNSPASWGNTA